MSTFARIVGGAALGRIGRHLMKRGVSMMNAPKAAQQAARQNRVRAIVGGVQNKTRGLAATPRQFSKLSGAGRQRRTMLATKIKAQRSGLIPSAQRIRSVHQKTRQGFQFSNAQLLAKKTATGRLNRSFLASSLRAARKGPHASPMFGYNPGTATPKTVSLQRKKP